jgi:hypothetical protein
MISGPVDVEWLAFSAGIKPAIRITIGVDEARSAAARFRRLGASVVGTTGLVGADRAPSAILYVAHGRSDAEELRAIEASLVAAQPLRDPERVLSLNALLGERLGYPKCCIHAFCARISSPQPGVSVTWLAARAAWVTTPLRRLNCLLHVERVRLITFEPCCYDCAAALQIADAVFERVRDLDGHAAALIDRELARPVVVAPEGSRAQVVLDRGAHTRIVSSVAPSDVEGNVVDLESVLRAPHFVGREVDSSGRLEGSGEPAAICIDFGKAMTTSEGRL